MPLIAGNHTWPTALNLVDSDFPGLGADAPAFKTDKRSWEKLETLALKEAKAGHREEIWASVTGKLRAPERYIRADGQIAGGYGHLGVFPAELVVERVFDVLIKPTPTYDYRELLGIHGAVGRKHFESVGVYGES